MMMKLIMEVKMNANAQTILRAQSGQHSSTKKNLYSSRLKTLNRLRTCKLKLSFKIEKKNTVHGLRGILIIRINQKKYRRTESLMKRKIFPKSIMKT